MQWQTGFEAQRVPGPEPSGRHPGAGHRLPDLVGDRLRHSELDAVLAGVAGAGHGARDAEQLDRLDPEAADRRCLCRHRGEVGARLGALHGEQGPSAGDVAATDRRHHPIGVRRVRHDVEALVIDPPHDDVVEH